MLGIGIVGLPNVGKSTLFNAITNAKAEAANYPFCTIEPNIGIVEVPDSRLEALARISASKKIIRSTVKFVDIAGLVKGASKGEGLGNKFLAHIASVNAIAHVVRCFDSENISHVSNTVDPIRDIEDINLELILSDLQTLQKAKDSKKRKFTPEELKEISLAISTLESEEILRESEFLKSFNLLTLKPTILVTNVADSDLKSGNKFTELVEKYANDRNIKVVRVSAQIEYEISLLNSEDKALFLSDLGVEQPSLDNLIVEGYSLLGLISFFTTGPQETRSWTIKSGETAYDSAAKIHDDIQRGFIRAEVTAYKDFISSQGKPKDLGLLRLEGKDYIVQSGDVVYFRFNV